MKRHINFFLSFFIVTVYLLMPSPALSQYRWPTKSLEPRYDAAGEKPKIVMNTRCVYVFTGETVPCSYDTSIIQAHEENNCQGSANTACGHNDNEHTLSRSQILNNNDTETARILGGLTDAMQPDKITAKLEKRENQMGYSFTYHSGEISGKITVKKVTKLVGGGFFLPPCKDEDRRYCTSIMDVNVEHCGGKYSCERFVELPEPWPPNEYDIYWSDGYVRCGMSEKCKDVPDNINPENWLEYDRPYNWPAHPTVHWGKWDFNFELRMLARKWYQTFGKPLVINDISLPKGGLLDVAKDWTAKMGHSSHRKGVNADILGVSVPLRMRPSSPDDFKWLALYRKYNLFDKLKLRCLEEKRDYNHLIYKGKIN